ncbi:hypothetical protein BBP40_008729 [Aspergillus hancockii]|nr:hypothetical protein BBP40_008729 [Aspergillus hancockii]
MQSGQDQFQDKCNTTILSPPFSASQDPLFSTRAEEASITPVENGRFLTGNPTQYFGPTQPAATSTMVDSNIPQRTGFKSKPTQGMGRIQTQSPLPLKSDYGESSPSPSRGYYQLRGSASADWC